MKRARVTPEAACQMLQEQLDELDQFRNASTRDAQFKQWRQSTLTVIHRIWPGVTLRSRRFRRVPFSPPSTLADARQVRESYERGCAEANQIIRSWITEIQTSGIQIEAAETVQPVSDEMVHGSPTLTLEGEAPHLEGADLLEHGVPTLDLPAADSGNAPTSMKSPRAGGTRKPAKAKVPTPPKAAKAEPVAKEEPVMKAEPAAAKRSSTLAKPREIGGRLKDMLGFGHLAASTGGPDESKRFEVTPNPALRPRGLGEHPPLRTFEDSPLDIPGFTPSAPPSPATPELPMPGLRPPPPPLDLGFPDVPGTPSDMERLDVADLELTVVHDPVDSPPPVARHANPAGAAEIIAIASEIPRLDVPASECERVRRTLLDLALLIERGDPSWDALRAATAVVMHYPKLGRRAMPVLLPFLDQTA